MGKNTFKPESIKIHSEKYLVILHHQDWDSDLDLDELTRIDYSNLFGEVVTVSALLNRVGLLKADVEAQLNITKLECDVFTANKKKEIVARETALGRKLSDPKIENLVIVDPEVIAMKKKVIYAQRDLQTVESMYWAVQSKDKKLSVLLKPTTPEEFVGEITEGKLNTFIIKKYKKQ